jgi:transcription elongation factor
MAGDLSNYAEGKLYDHLLNRSAFTMPSAVYLALFTAVTDAEAGTGTEVAVAGYARQACAMGAMTPGTDTPGSNTGTITFGPLTGGAGTATHAALFDASSAGNPLTAIKALATARAWLAGDSIVFNPGDVTFSLT